jgi:hypothetical protein
MSENQSRTASDDLYDHEREDPRSGRRRRPVADWGVGEDMFEHMPRNRFSRAAEGPPRDRRFSRAAEADRREPPEARVAEEPEGVRDSGPSESAGRDWADWGREDEVVARDDSLRAVREEPRRWTGPDRDDADADDEPAAAARRRAQGPPQEDLPRGRVEDGRRTIVIGKPEDVPSEIAAITADRDRGADAPAEPEAPVPAPAERERRTVRIGGRPEGSLEAARYHRDHSRRRPAPRPHERLGARPDRIAMWAFALGLLLIVIAVLTAH